MRRSRIYQQQKLIADSTLVLDSEGSHYLGRVLRLKPGDAVNLFNSNDGEFSATVERVDRHSVTVKLLEKQENFANPQLAVHLGLGLSRGERFDYAIQKSTELGVSLITPVVTEFCEVRLGQDRLQKKSAHWQKVAISASEQCGRSSVPEIGEPMDLGEWLNRYPGGILLDGSGEPGFSTLSPSGTLILLIGPEGGFSDAEVLSAQQHRYRCVRLGPRVLRTETAPVVALTLLQYLFGDLQS